ncbi:MAG: multicopper oxidase domain-containing protein, partial [Pyrinomonadaceae bacterium]|nr:multicopper oxidase domain-containing protein [Phycisphaerales bacterium]
TIQSVQLTMYMSRTRAGTQNVTLSRLLADWGEGASDSGVPGGTGDISEQADATWLHRFYPGTLWTTPGGDFVPTVSGSASVGGIGFYNWSSGGITSDVQQWVNGVNPNYGWIIRASETGNTSTKSFNTRNSTDPTHRPRLVVTFTSPANYGSCCLPSGICTLQTAAACASLGGSFQGAGTACNPNPCPQPPGACCFANTTCIELTEAACVAQGGTFSGANTTCGSVICPRVLAKFVDALPIPPIATPTTGTIGGAATYDAVIGQFTQRLHRDLPITTVWGVNGTYPGPTIETSAGQPVNVHWINDLRDEQGNLRQHHYFPVDLCLDGPNTAGDACRTTIHLHGAHVDPSSDGDPENTVLPGSQQNFTYPNGQLATTLWYHDHAIGITRLNVYMGIAGFYMIRDAVENALALPRGEYEIPLLIQDRSFHNDGTLKYQDGWEDHFFGDTALVNGKVWPYLNVKRGKYRFRMVNGSTSRTYTLSLSNGIGFYQIGSDGGLLAAPVLMDNITMAPGERCDIVVDFSNVAVGSEVLLANSAPINFPGVPGDNNLPQIMKFVVQNQNGYLDPLPLALRPVPRTSENAARVIRTLNIQLFADPCMGTAWLINGLMYDDVVETPRLGSTEIWRFVNRSPIMHPMHMHLVQFQILDRQGFALVNNLPVPVGPRFPPPANELGWKDTVQTMPGEITRVIARFTGFTGLFPYHCHLLEHEDHDMMRQMLVLPQCVCDFNSDVIVDTRDYFAFIALFFVNNADVNDDGVTTSQDFFDFIGCFFAGCD